MAQSMNTGQPLAGTGDRAPAGVALEAIHLNIAGRKLVHPLQDMSLYIPAHSLVAVSGPAGSGKTTLLETLAGVRTADSGQVEIDGVNLASNRKSFIPWIGYASSQNTLHPELTVGEELASAARLRVPKGSSASMRQEGIEQLLKLFSLASLQNKRISSLTPFEQTLTQIAVEVIPWPAILLVDEPEKPYDPASARFLTDLLRTLVDKGMTVMFVTQLPTAMQSADRLVLLDRGGYLVWYGPPDEAQPFFAAGDNHSSTGTTSGGFDAIFYHNQKSPKEWAAQYKSFPGYTKYIDDPISGKRRDLMMEDRPLSRLRGVNDEPQVPPPPAYGSSIGQYFTLLFRNLRLFLRDRAALLMGIAAPIILGVVLLLIANPGMYAPTGGDAGQINQVFAALAFLALMISSFTFIRSVIAERAAVKRERQINLRTLPYALSKFTLIAPVAFFQALVVTLVYGAATRFQGGVPASVGIFITLFLAGLVGGGLGLVASALGNSVQTALVWGLALVLPQLIFGGILIPAQQQGLVGRSIAKVMPARVAFESLVSASGYGSDIAQDICWTLPAEARAALSPEQKQSCPCMGDNIFQACTFPGIRTAVTPALDQPEPVAPIPDTGISELPVQPLLQPGESAQQYANEIGQYTLQLERYQGIVSGYLSTLQQYADAALAWQKLQSYAVGAAETRISDQIARYGPVYSINLGTHWLGLLATSLGLLVVFILVQTGKGRAR